MSRLVTPTGTKGCASHVALAAPFVPVARPGTKGPPLLSWPGVPGWEIGIIRISQLEQISVSVVVLAFLDIIARTPRPAISCGTSFSKLLWIPSVQQATTPLVNTVLTCYFDPKTFKMQFVCVLFLKNKSCGCRFS